MQTPARAHGHLPRASCQPQGGHACPSHPSSSAGSWLCQPPSFISPPTTNSGTTCTLGREAGGTTSPCWPGPSPGVSTPPLQRSPCAHPASSQESAAGLLAPTFSAWLSWHGALMAPARLPERTGLMPDVPSIAVGAVTVISPLELIRTKMQSRQLSYRELGVCIQSAVAQDGWLSLWRGWGPTVLRDVPFSGMAAGGQGEQWHWEMGERAQGRAALRVGRGEVGMSGVPCSSGVSLLPALYWFNYELVREWLCGQTRLNEATFMISFASGAISGTVSLGSCGLHRAGARSAVSWGRNSPHGEQGMGLGWRWEVTAGLGRRWEVTAELAQVPAHRPAADPAGGCSADAAL